MPSLREAATQALEALKLWDTVGEQPSWHRRKERQDAITALRAALEEPVQEPVQEPVACHVFNVTVKGRLHEWEPTTFAFALRDGKHALYTAPPQRKPLTEEEIINIGKEARAIEGPHILPVSFARAIERAHGIGGDDA